jgi:hypothetical protein
MQPRRREAAKEDLGKQAATKTRKHETKQQRKAYGTSDRHGHIEQRRGRGIRLKADHCALGTRARIRARNSAEGLCETGVRDQSLSITRQPRPTAMRLACTVRSSMATGSIRAGHSSCGNGDSVSVTTGAGTWSVRYVWSTPWCIPTTPTWMRTRSSEGVAQMIRH